METKKKLPKPLKILLGIFAVLLIILILLYIFLPVPLSQWTNGALCGAGVETISEEELETGDIRPVTEKEQDSYQKFAERHHKAAKRKMVGEKKDYYEAMLLIPELIIDLSNGEVPITVDEYDAYLDDLIASANLSELESIDTSKSSGALFSMTAYASDPDDGSEPMDEETMRNMMMHNFAEALYVEGAYEYSTAFAALAAANAPNSYPTANLLGNLLKQNDDLYNALDMYEYAIRLNPDDEASLVNAGNVCIDLGKYDLAERYFNRALQVSEGDGPANQGMMLVSLAHGDDHSAFLYMIEGAKDAYTSILTDAYAYFRTKYKKREDYLDFAGPIMDQYGFKYLTDFTRSRTMFDPTLDTPGQQLTLDRTLILPKNGADVWHSSLVSLYNGTYTNMMALLKVLVGEEALASFMSTGSIDAMFTSEEAIAFMAENGISMGGMGASLGSLALSMKDENSSLMDMYGSLMNLVETTQENLGYNPPASITSTGENFEQEVFWMRILYDYTEYKFLELNEKYITSLEQKYVYDSLDISLLNIDKEISKIEGMGQYDQIIHMLSCFFTNGSPIASRQYTIDEVERMGSQLCGFNPYLKKGYMECIMLAEEYWLYTNNILAYISNDAIYNRMRITRDQLAVRVATHFPMMAGTYHGSVGITAPGWAGVTFNWWFQDPSNMIYSALNDLGSGEYVTYPKVPELPITGMGTEVKPPIQIKVKVPAPEQFIEQIEDLMGDSDEIFIDIRVDDFDGDGEEDMVQTYTQPPETQETTTQEETTPEESSPSESSEGAGEPKPEANPEESSGPKTESKTVFALGDFGLGIGKELIKEVANVSYNAETGEFEVAFDLRVFGVKFGASPITGDLTVYVQGGLDLNKNLFKKDKKTQSVGDVEVSVGGAKATGVLFLKGTLNTRNLTTSAVEYGATAGAQLSGAIGAGETVSWNILTGVKKDSAYKIFAGVKEVLETETQSYTGLLELLDFSKWFKD